MNISSQAEFLVELEQGQSLGYKPKFLLYPNQLHWYEVFRKEEILRQLQWADKVVSIG
jgi:hypothetical protein